MTTSPPRPPLASPVPPLPSISTTPVVDDPAGLRGFDGADRPDGPPPLLPPGGGGRPPRGGGPSRAPRPSRRTVLAAGLAVVVAGAADLTIPRLVHRNGSESTEKISGQVIDFEGSGGDADDSDALEQAVQDFQRAPDGTTLRLHGRIRVARRGGMGPSGFPGAALLVQGGNDKTVLFDTSTITELIVDNLKNGEGTSHGICWLGAGRGNALLNASVRWATRPSKRGLGDGIRVVGYPSDSAPPASWDYTTGLMSDFVLSDWTVQDCPGAGVIFMGCSDPISRRGTSTDSHADGLHFNACRRPVVIGHTSTDVGDDGLAFVTYYGEDVGEAKRGPFNQPGFGEWSNSEAKVSDVVVTGGRANGMRVAGVNGISVSNLSVTDKSGAGVIVDSAIINETYRWTYLASRGVTITDSKIDQCGQGVMVTAENVHADDDNGFRDFQVKVTDTDVTDTDGNDDWVIAAPSDMLASLTNDVSFPSGIKVSRRTLN